MFYYNISLYDSDGDTYNNVICHDKKWTDKEFKYFLFKAVEIVSQTEEGNNLDISENIDEIINYMVETFKFIAVDISQGISFYYDLSLDKVKEVLSE